MLHIQPFDINSVIKATAASFEGSCTSRNILLELILSGKELMAQADMEQIQQVLYNLLSNAIKFSPDNSTITLETTEKNGKIFVSVKDHGIGIPKASLQKIWERFYKIDRSRGKDQKGTGLGLATSRDSSCTWTTHQCDQYRGCWNRIYFLHWKRQSREFHPLCLLSFIFFLIPRMVMKLSLKLHMIKMILPQCS